MQKETIDGKELEYELSHVRPPKAQKSDDWQDLADRWLFEVGGHEFDYYTGIGHREFKPNYVTTYLGNNCYTWTKKEFEKKRHQKLTEHGFKLFIESSKPTPPSLKDLLFALTMDAGALDELFGDWCDNFGYDSDSIKAKGVYEKCQQNAIKLKSMGFNIESLREFYEDY